ncbi:hypothetical protein MJO28_009580 [Puccinia striiformis f. sp. tritici]|uniref:Uncharacterized protein n=1 Tax=Puccinia striiformis f. sp. tritici TaxID=168172 RepID=A0ACC0E8T5_9BASI|nr:hypothetical protein MJO28_009580 [Puccinia striiformis f. sp. tritici]
MIFGIFLPFILVIGQCIIAPQIPIPGAVSKHPPPGINPSTEIFESSLTSSSLNKLPLDKKLSRQDEHRIAILDLSTTPRHEPSLDTGLERLDSNLGIPPTDQRISTAMVPSKLEKCLGGFSRLPCVYQTAIALCLGASIAIILILICGAVGK